jgi:ABC-2 type transport system ATP-binding protein
LLAPDGGTHDLGADPFHEPRKAAASIGYVSQRFTLYGDLSIDENVVPFARIHGARLCVRRSRLPSLTGLEPFAGGWHRSCRAA